MIDRQSPTREIRELDLGRKRQSIHHVGLAYEKLAPHSSLSESRDEANRFLRALAEATPVPSVYPTAFRRWVRRTMNGPLAQPQGYGRRVLVGISQGRVLCGLGELTPTENGLAIHQTYGVPYIPGSSLKGIVRAWLESTEPAGTPWASDGTAFEEVLGTASNSDEEDGGTNGLVSFYDALWVPAHQGVPDEPFAAEIVTPHFGDYYQSKAGNIASPDGTQSPIPVTFLAAQGAFRLVIEGPEALLDRVADILRRALAERGVGAKTRAGYGRLLIVDGLTKDDDFEADEQRARADRLEREQRMNAASSAADILELMRTMEDTDPQQLSLQLKWWLSGAEQTDERLRRFAVTPESAVQAWNWAGEHGLTKGLLKKLRETVPAAVVEAIEASLGIGAAAPQASQPSRPATGDSSFGSHSLKAADFKKLFKRDGTINASHFDKLFKKRLERAAVDAFIERLEAGGATDEAAAVREKYDL